MADSYKGLLAKSEPKITLQEHIDDCLLIADFLEVSFPTINSLSSIKVDFWEVLRICIVFHDLGKAHAEFQKVLNGIKVNDWHGQRHELFSLPFVESLAVEEPLKNLIRLVVAGHHKEFSELKKRYISNTYLARNEEDDGSKFEYQSEFKKVDVASVLNLLKEVYGQEINIPTILNPITSLRHYPPKEVYWLNNRPDIIEHLLLFGAMKHCDHMGSAQVKKLGCIQLDDFQFLDKRTPYWHQAASSNIIGNLILTSPTGSGKTESALFWLRNQMTHFGQGRVYYILPFTASINAMFERLQAAFGDGKVGMLHGKLSDYLYDYFDDFQYSISEKKEQIDAIKQKFKTLVTPVKVVTPFQLLKHIFGLKGHEQGLFEMVGGYFIFDEIHAYNSEVFAQIKVLLEFSTKYLGVKVMVMTATMPKFLKYEIETTLGSYASVKAQKQLYTEFTRHQIILENGLLGDNLQKIQTDLIVHKKKVLVVCNTVQQAQHVYEHLKEYAAKSVLLHSAFNGEDRTDNEKKLKKGEADNTDDKIQLLVGTQAIEVSLDIDYDVIYTEPAPIDALIQRFGRVNRKRKKGICPVIVFREANDNDKFIYNTELTEKTLKVFEKIVLEANGIIEEEKLQQYIDEVYETWEPTNYENFKRVYDLLTHTVNQLKPMIHSKDAEEDFYKQFDGIKVLPQCFHQQFINRLERFDFIGAERLKVQIRKNLYAAWMFRDNIRKQSFIFEKKDGKLLEIKYLVVNKKYEGVLGFQRNENEEWQPEDVYF